MNKEQKKEELEKLVAYLDGEVSEQEAIQVEQALSRDEAIREHADSLEQTWQLLDRLPNARASEEFTNKTLSTIKTIQLEAQSKEDQRQSGFSLSKKTREQVRKVGVTGGWMIGLACSMFFGYMLANQWIPEESEPLLSELSFIENLDTYSEVQSLEFLEELQNAGTFNETAQQQNQ